MTFAPGLVLNERYEIRASLPPQQGAGCFRALDRALGRDVRIQPYDLPPDPEAIPVLDRRTHALAGIQDARVRAFLDGGMLRRQGFVVTPWLTGFTLAELAPLPGERLLAWALQGSAALEAAHAHGVVHGAVSAASLVEVPGQGILLQDFAFPGQDAKDPAEDFRALARALGGALQGAPQGRLQQVLTELGAGRPPAPEAPPSPPRKATALTWAGGTLLTLLLLGATGWAGMQWLHPPGLASRRAEAVGEARRLYLEGRHHWNNRSKTNLIKAEACFTKAIDLDPGFMEAYVSLAECQVLMAVFGHGTSEASVRRTRETLRTLARLDPDNREAGVVEAYLLFRYEHRWKEAEALFRKGLEPGSLGAQDPTRLHWFGLFLSCQGRHEEALEVLGKAVVLEPLNLQARTNLAVAHAWAGHRSEALEIFEGIRELDPHFNSALERLRILHESWGNLQKSIDLAESSEPVPAVRSLREAFAARGARGFWEQRLWEFEALERTTGVDPYFVAYAHTALGDRDGAFRDLEKALARNSPFLVWVGQDPSLAPLRSDPRFREVLRRVNLD